jgi:hypothetical protein
MVELFLWGNAETCVTIVAASIPTLRILLLSVRRRHNGSCDEPNNIQSSFLNSLHISTRPQDVTTEHQPASRVSESKDREDPWTIADTAVKDVSPSISTGPEEMPPKSRGRDEYAEAQKPHI